MPAAFPAHVSLDKATWEWHRRNPGKLSKLARERVAQEIEREKRRS
ncbi:hypothetical protein M0R72_11115 [Candidatus Pacearchaeota archaeon]|jgi:hypothetical protein|nr:hypothetical protein [Candidatus Pacearchaeota archaeon]